MNSMMIMFVVVGLAILDLFTVRCTGWKNCHGIRNGQLTYNYYVAYKNDTAPLPMYSGRNTTVNLMFPTGDPDDDYRTQLTVVVSNGANYTTELTVYPVIVSQLNAPPRRYPLPGVYALAR